MSDERMDCDGGLGEEAAYQSVAEYEAWAKATIAARDAELAALRKQVEVMREALTKIAAMPSCAAFNFEYPKEWDESFSVAERDSLLQLVKNGWKCGVEQAAEAARAATDAACRAAGVEVEGA